LSKPKQKNQSDVTESAVDADFVEQAEYIPRADFIALSAEHPDEDMIVKKLSTGGAKLLVGPRGCGKSTLMLKSYYGLIDSKIRSSLPVYVNFKLSLKLEPLYVNTPNAAFWFRQWLVLMVYKGLNKTLSDAGLSADIDGIIPEDKLSTALTRLESGAQIPKSIEDALSIDGLSTTISKVMSEYGYTRCVLLLDDAAHAFSARQQEDFFEFFREIKSREISPKAAIYPGITTHSPTFHVGHDAEQIDAWVRPDRTEYVAFMSSLARRRFRGGLPPKLFDDEQIISLLAYASFGVPRAFLAMVRSAYQDLLDKGPSSSIDRRSVFEYARQAKESAHNVYDSLAVKVPAYKEFVTAGRELYQQIIAYVKEFNKGRAHTDQAIEVGLKKPLPPEMVKVLGFFQYAGLMMPSGQNSRGEKGSFELFLIHAGDLITENAVISKKVKVISEYVTAFSSQTHQTWPRINPERLVRSGEFADRFRLSLPQCQVCGAERVNEHAKFCATCGSQLKTASLYKQLVEQDIGVLPISAKLVKRIKEESSIKTIKDILLDADRKSLRGVGYVGPVRASRIAHYAEEYLA
jgi:hypothetical protein